MRHARERVGVPRHFCRRGWARVRGRGFGGGDARAKRAPRAFPLRKACAYLFLLPLEAHGTRLAQVHRRKDGAVGKPKSAEAASGGPEPVASLRVIERPRRPPLTPRQAEILRHVAAGLQNKEIAQRMGLSLC